jgi:hypothetical protein
MSPGEDLVRLTGTYLPYLSTILRDPVLRDCSAVPGSILQRPELGVSDSK